MQKLALLIPGAQKAGTSSFLRYFAQHPDICTHQQPEMNYFVNQTEFQRGFTAAIDRYFPCVHSKNLLVGKSVGILDSPTFLQRVYQHNPNINIIILLRHPVDRAYSSYWFARRKGWEPLRRFEDAVEASPARFAGDELRERECAYLQRGIYVTQINNLLDFFPTEQVHIFLLDDIKKDIVFVCQTLYQICGLSSEFVPEVSRRHNVATVARSNALAYLMSSFKPFKKNLRRILPTTTGDKLKHSLQRLNQKQVDIPEMQPETRSKLLAFYRPYNLELSRLLNRDLSHWDQ